MSQLSFISFHDSLIFVHFAFSGVMLWLTAILRGFVLFPVCERDGQQSLLLKAQHSKGILFRKRKTILCNPDPKPRVIEVLNIFLPILPLIFANPNKPNTYAACFLACWGLGGREEGNKTTFSTSSEIQPTWHMAYCKTSAVSDWIVQTFVCVKVFKEISRIYVNATGRHYKMTHCHRTWKRL